MSPLEVRSKKRSSVPGPHDASYLHRAFGPDCLDVQSAERFWYIGYVSPVPGNVKLYNFKVGQQRRRYRLKAAAVNVTSASHNHVSPSCIHGSFMKGMHERIASDQDCKQWKL